MSVSSDSDTKVAFVKDLKDPSDTHKYSYNSVITAVQERLKKKNVKLGYSSGFNQYVLNLIIDFYNIKQDAKYAYEHIIGNQHSYTYSQQFIDFIVFEIEKNPQNFVESLKKANKKDNPRHIGMLSTKYLPHYGTQCYSFTSYLFCIITYSIILSIIQYLQNKKI